MNFKTEVCSCSVCPTDAMWCFREVEVAKSVDHLVTSQSIRGHRFPNFEMLDAKIASALKRIISNPYFGRIRLEEQKAQTQDLFLRGRQIAHMSYEHFRVTGAHEAALDLADLFSVSKQSDDIQDSDTRQDKSLLTSSEMPKHDVQESVYKMRIRGSAQLQTVQGIYEQDIDQYRSTPCCQKLKTMVRRHIDQTVRTRNFRVRNEKIETGVCGQE